MPRGQYDRTLSKEQRAALKKTGTKKTARTAVADVKKVYRTKTFSAKTAASTPAVNKAEQVNILLAYFTTLNNARLSGSKNPLIDAEVNETILQLKTLREEIFGKVTTPAPAQTTASVPVTQTIGPATFVPPSPQPA